MITFHDLAPAGSVSTLDEYAPSDFTPADVILCRNTAPLVALAFGLIRRGVGCRVLGRDFGANLIALVEGTKTYTLPDLTVALDRLREKEVGRALRKGDQPAAAAIDDKFNCLQLFTANATSVEGVVQKLKDLFSDESRGLLTLSTIHKAKGLEWSTVFLLDRGLMPSKFAKSDWERRQESNLMYVAITRAKLHLKYITSNSWSELGHSPNETNNEHN